MEISNKKIKIKPAYKKRVEEYKWFVKDRNKLNFFNPGGVFGNERPENAISDPNGLEPIQCIKYFETYGEHLPCKDKPEYLWLLSGKFKRDLRIREWSLSIFEFPAVITEYIDCYTYKLDDNGTPVIENNNIVMVPDPIPNSILMATVKAVLSLMKTNNYEDWLICFYKNYFERLIKEKGE